LPLTLNDLVRSTIDFKATRAKPPRISVSRFEITAFNKGGGLLARTWKKLKKAVASKIQQLLKKGKTPDTDDETAAVPSMVMVKSVAKSQVGAGVYNTYLLAKDVSVSEEKDKEHRVKTTDKSYISHIDYKKTEVKVRCDCPDFRWRFAWYNDQKEALYGLRPPPYRRKTNRPPVNPRHLPGMCKHLMNVVKILASRQVIR
jgi:hypothetical protein